MLSEENNRVIDACRLHEFKSKCELLAKNSLETCIALNSLNARDGNS